MLRNVLVSDVQFDIKNYPRTGVNHEVVNEYADAMKGGAKFPPIVVFQDGESFHLADGAHRLSAHKKMGEARISSDVRKGDQRAALAYAVGANDKHGHRRTSEDKRKAVELVLKDEKWRNRSTNSLAEMCAVSWGTVQSVWKDKRVEFDLPVRKIVETATAGKPGKQKVKKVAPQPEPCNSISALSRMLQHADAARSWLTHEIEQGVTPNTKITKARGKKICAQLDEYHDGIHTLLAELAGATTRNIKTRQPLNVYHFERENGIVANKEFAKKGLCTHSVCVGLGCGNQCTYCSTAVMLRTRDFFKTIHQTSFARGNAIVDPQSAEHLEAAIKRDGWDKKLTADDTILFSNIDDGWSPEAHEFDLGRKVMEVLLEKTKANIRILTKGAAVASSFDLFKEYPERVIVGLSTGIPKSSAGVDIIIEPNASSIKDRLAALKKAHDMGLRTYGMLCPCLPGIADTKAALEEMFKEVLACGAEEIWLEPVNPRGCAMANTANALARAGKIKEAEKMQSITSSDVWSKYAVDLIENAIDVATKKKVLDKLRVLLYPSGLKQEDEEKLRTHKDGIIWL